MTPEELSQARGRLQAFAEQVFAPPAENNAPAELVGQAKIRWRVEHDYRELKTALGLDHFEGRYWISWHRHVMLASA